MPAPPYVPKIGRWIYMKGASLIAGAVGGVLFATAAAADNLELPPGPGRDLVYGQCRTCHDLEYLKESAGVPRSTWNDLLDSMKQYGLRISPEQRTKILDYLGTYLGPNPPPKSAAAAPAAPAKVDGATVFSEQCAACHQPNGEGVAGQFPPLGHNADLFLAPDYPLRVVLFGLKGKITVDGKSVDSEMPSLDVLSDAQIAAAVNHVRGAFGNDALRPKSMQPVTPDMVAALRKQKLTAAQVFDYRKNLKAAAK
jgi:mono/diheme cytochrome c family protein